MGGVNILGRISQNNFLVPQSISPVFMDIIHVFFVTCVQRQLKIKGLGGHGHIIKQGHIMRRGHIRKCFGLSCGGPVYFLRNFTEFHDMSMECQIILIFFLLLVSHKWVAITKQ